MANKQQFQKTVQIWDAAAQKLPWSKKWHTMLQWNEPFAHWFVGGEINASYACLDVHIERGLGGKTALIWQSETGEKVQYTYQELYQEVNNFAHFLQSQGVKKGDPVIIYMPVMPQTLIAMLAVARLGAIHVVVFSGFGAVALKDRIEDVAARFVITADYVARRGKKINLKAIVDQAVGNNSVVEKVIVVDRAQFLPNFAKAALRLPLRQGYVGQEGYAGQEGQTDSPIHITPVGVEANHPLFILYTSGTTGKPKGIVHSTGGYLTHCYTTFEQAFAPTPSDVYWCTADFGWITGHSYVVYAPLMHGLTVFLYEGTPDYPDPGIWWSLIEQYKITILYTSPTALRMAIKAGDAWPKAHNLSSLSKLGSVGEPINPEVWKWYFTTIGASRCPVIDTWWQTETGGFMIAPMATQPRADFRPGSAGKPLPGIAAHVLTEQGAPAGANEKGYLVIQEPWPGMCIGIYNDPERFKEVYWSKFKHVYYTGDYAYKDHEGNFWLLGRADEVLNIAGHRVGTAEIESAALQHAEVAEAAAIGIADEIRGEQVVLFVTLKQPHMPRPALDDEIRAMIRTHIGSFVTASRIYYVKQLPKTRSGKIMRRLLKGVLMGASLGDVSTLEDQASLDEVTAMYAVLQAEIGK
jgi:acetyl-CoA synthetase